MRVGLIAGVLLIVAVSAALIAVLVVTPDPPPAPPGPSPINTTICALVETPEAYDLRVIRIHAYVSQGFEDSTLHDPACPNGDENARSSPSAVWLSYADEQLPLGVWPHIPVVNDAKLSALRKTLLDRADTSQMKGATMVGTFYAGQREVVNGKSFIRNGYGNGIFSLFVLSRVESVDTEYSENLRYFDGDSLVGVDFGCMGENGLGAPTYAQIRSWQRAASAGRDSWRYDGRAVAEDHLRRLKSGEYGGLVGQYRLPSTGLVADTPQEAFTAPHQRDYRWRITRRGDRPQESFMAPYLRRYEWTAGRYEWRPGHSDGEVRVVIVVARPYWLLSLAGTPERVIWAPLGASLLHCVPNTPTAPSPSHTLPASRECP